MGNITGKTNLAAFKHGIAEVKGQECIIIPIEKNNLFKSEKGNVYFDWIAFEIPKEKRSDDRPDTHIVSQSLAKEVKEALPSSTYPPTLGNCIDWDQTNRGEAKPNTDNSVQGDIEGADDLPF